MYEEKIKQLEKRLVKEAIQLSSSFNTQDRNKVIRTAIELRVLKNLDNVKS